MKLLLSLMLLFSVSLLSYAGDSSALKNLAVQDSGRIKPFDTFAKETLKMVYGKTSYEGRPAHEILMTWVLSPQLWQDKAIFEINYRGLKEALKLPMEKKHFSFAEILGSDQLSTIMQELVSQRESKAKLSPYFQSVQRLENQIFLFKEVGAGRIPGFMPPTEGKNWLSLSQLTGEDQELFMNITKEFLSQLGADGASDLAGAVAKFSQKVQSINSEAKPDATRIKMEIHYNDFHPFRWAWVLYALGAIFVSVAWFGGVSRFWMASWVVILLGFVLHTYGFALRVYLAERPPVSNMYESVVWVSWGALLFSMIIEKIYKFRVTLLAGSIVALLCMILADIAPSVLDPSIQPLEPVLRSSFWLTVHVLTITISYSAYFLAFILGDIGLIYIYKGEKAHAEKVQTVVQGIYRAIQIGTVLLAAGTILGGVWADYSWGRFWGWDPKETWALIALLGYLAVLHGRLAGWLKNFGMINGAIISFSLVLMAWYGVNYVLGAGLHSYGFGAGGVEYVTAFVLAHILAVIFVTFFRKKDA